MDPDRPWLRFYGDVPPRLDYPQVSLYQALMKTVRRHGQATAYDFMGCSATYGRMAEQIDQMADALAALGLRAGDRMTLAMPTCPQAVICFYAVNKIGAVASMIHPLSPAKEIAFYLNLSHSRFALTLDAFYPAVKEATAHAPIEKLILTSIADALGCLKKIGFKLTKGRQITPVPDDPLVVWWRDLMRTDFPAAPVAEMDTDDLAVILYSGGTTGTPKGIMLSNRNMICEGMQVAAWGKMGKGHSILAILPVFHGFGLGVCVNAIFMGGGKSILVPRFTPEDVARLVRTCRPDFLVGVPTLFEALNRSAVFGKAELACLKAVFCGADQLPMVVKQRFESIVQRQGGQVKLLQGYGLTEAVTAIMAMPMGHFREGSIGVPFPDMDAKVVDPVTLTTQPPGKEGEICLHGPAVMLGYLDQPEETDKVLRKHPDGRVWLHTGDLGHMDSDGFFYFTTRLKRMIKSSGMNVYPAQVEEVLYGHEDVLDACVIGVPDTAQVERVKAFVVLKDPQKASPETADVLMDHCRSHLIKWSCPREIEFRNELPKTLVGKVAFNVLKEEELQRSQDLAAQHQA